MIEFAPDDEAAEAMTRPAPWWTTHHTLFREGDRYNYTCEGGMMISGGPWIDRPKRCTALLCGRELIEETEREALLRPLKEQNTALAAALRGLLDTVTGMQDQGAKTYSGDKERIAAAETALKAAGEEV